MEAPSPYLPSTKIRFAWDSTILGDFKTCPRLYHYRHNEGWQGKAESIHLRFGREYHQALQEYDVSRANGVKHEDAIHDSIHSLLGRIHGWNPDRSTKAGKYKNPETLVSLVVDYLDHFVDDAAETYIKADGTAAVELSFAFELEFGPRPDLEPPHEWAQPYLLCGHLDKVVNLNSALLVKDYKTTTTTIGSYYFDQWEPHNQMSLYTLAGRIVLDAPIKGVIIDAAQILLEEPNRFARGFTYRTQDQLDEWLDDLEILLRQAEGYATQDYWPMNDTACDKYGGCQFREICSKSPAVRERFLKADFIQLEEKERWNPLKPR